MACAIMNTLKISILFPRFSFYILAENSHSFNTKLEGGKE